MKKAGTIFYLLVMCFAITSENIYSQGCSDAGFCTAGALQAESSVDSSGAGAVAIKTIFGLGEQGVVIWQIMPEIEIIIAQRGRIQATIPFVSTSGNLGSSNGWGDVIASYTYMLPLNDITSISFTAGARIPTGTTNIEYTNRTSLPMPYQTGLGTWDLILGGSLRYKKWSIATGLQKVLHRDNKNTYLHKVIMFDNDVEDDYFESNLLKRGDDVLLRLGRLFETKKLALTPGILVLYRLQKDKITNDIGNEISVSGSDGVTLNLTANANFALNKKFNLIVDAGMPIVVRENRPDGLTRSLVLSGSLRYKF